MIIDFVGLTHCSLISITVMVYHNKGLSSSQIFSFIDTVFGKRLKGKDSEPMLNN